MNLYHLKPQPGLPEGKDGFTASRDENPWDYAWESNHAFVIRAASEEEARRIASEDADQEGKEAWLNPKYSTCEVLLPEGESGIIVSDYLES